VHVHRPRALLYSAAAAGTASHTAAEAQAGRSALLDTVLGGRNEFYSQQNSQFVKGIGA